jgi:hypothetical protein
MKEVDHNKDYKELIQQISETFQQGQKLAVIAVNSHLVDTYWKVGQYIVEFEQKGKERATYGKGLIEQLSKDLTFLHGKGFSLSNVKRMKQFYLAYPISAELPHQLSWTHWNEENTEGDNHPIGIVLAREKDELVVKYAMHNISSRLFVSKYQLYLPDKEELKALVEKQLYQNDE